MILSIAHTKGGVGKTTIAIQIVTYLRAVKKLEKVLLVDADSQRAALNSITRRNESEQNYPKVVCSSLIKGSELKTQIDIQKEMWQEIVIDLGARNSDSLRAALMCSDAVLIPFQPLSYSLEAYEEFSQILKDARNFGAHFKTYGFINFADVQGNANLEAQEYIEQLEDIQYLDCKIARRKATTSASTYGLSVFEEKPKDPKACAEIANLMEMLYGY